MKKRRFAYSLAKKLCYLPLFLLATISFAPGCHKSNHTNPCEGVLSEGTPTMVGLILLDGQTGENILLSKNVDASSITITPEASDVPSEQGMIVKQPGSPMDGSLVFHIADTKKGAFTYKIDVTGVGSITLSYTNKEEKSNNECNPYYINVTDPVIENHQYTFLRTGYRLLFNVTL